MARSKMKICALLKIVFMLCSSTVSLTDIARFAGCSLSTIKRTKRRLDKIVRRHVLVLNRWSGKLRGIVEIDESLFNKRKYHKGSKKQGTWVFGIYSRKRGEIRLFPVKNRSQETLISLIRKNVHVYGSRVYSDEWKGYMNLSKYGYSHYTVKHKDGFVKDVNGVKIHTNSIEGCWGRSKRTFRTNRKLRSQMAWIMIKNKLDYNEVFLSLVKHLVRPK